MQHHNHMNPKLTTLQPAAAPEPKPLSRPKRSIRRQAHMDLITGSGPGVLLSHEDSHALKTLRQSFHDRFNAKSAIDLVLAELATSSAWRALRTIHLESAFIDTELAEQADAADRDFEDIDDVCRTALLFHNPAFTRILRQFSQTGNDCQRNLLQLLRNRAAGAGY